jgi:hypothetical protein
MITVYSENLTKADVLCGQNAEFLNIKARATYGDEHDSAVKPESHLNYTG